MARSMLPKVSLTLLQRLSCTTSELFSCLRCATAEAMNWKDITWAPCSEAWAMGYRHSPVVAQESHLGVVTSKMSLEREFLLTDNRPGLEGDTCFGVVSDDLFVFTRSQKRSVEIDEELDAGYGVAGLDWHQGKRIAGALETEVLGTWFDGTGQLLPKERRWGWLLLGTVESCAARDCSTGHGSCGRSVVLGFIVVAPRII